jgi:hypothetical protein
MAKRPSLSEQAERKLRLAAAAKVRADKPLASNELAALKRHEKERADETRAHLLATCPKGVFTELTGKRPKVVNDLGTRYGLTVRGKTVDLGVVLTQLFDLLTRLSRNPLKALDALGFPVDDDSLAMAGGDGPSLERWRAAKAELAEMEVQERRGNLIPRAIVHQSFAIEASLHRTCGAQLQKQFGPEAHDIFNEMLDACARENNTLCGGGDAPSDERSE